jgi:hypothetical protein
VLRVTGASLVTQSTSVHWMITLEKVMTSPES